MTRRHQFKYGSEGIFGIPLWVSSTFVYAFVLFGAIFERTGAGEFLMKLAMSLVGHTRGRPAKVSVVASAFMGTISGSGVANTATIGTLTIPLMKKVGSSPSSPAATASSCRRSWGPPPSSWPSSWGSPTWMSASPQPCRR